MAKPTIANAVWATDANIASGAETGSPTKVDPGAGYSAQGAVPGLQFVAPYWNYKLNQYYQWAQYLDNLPNESAFLGANFNWTGLHKFDPSGIGTQEPQWTAPKRISKVIPMSNVMAKDGSWDQNFTSFPYSWFTSVNNDPLYIDLTSEIPHGATINGVRVVVRPGTAQTGGNRMAIRLVRPTLSLYSGGGISGTATGVAVTGGDLEGDVFPTASTTSITAVDLIPTSTLTMNNGYYGALATTAAYGLYVFITSQLAGVGSDVYYGCVVDYTETVANRRW